MRDNLAFYRVEDWKECEELCVLRCRGKHKYKIFEGMDTFGKNGRGGKGSEEG